MESVGCDAPRMRSFSRVFLLAIAMAYEVAGMHPLTGLSNQVVWQVVFSFFDSFGKINFLLRDLP